MPLYSVDIEKRLGSEFWSNRYIVSAVDFPTAEAFAQNIVLVEQPAHSGSVLFTRYRVSSNVQGDGVYTVAAINQPGGRGGSTSLLPLFNTLRVDINANTGRPSRKFYRGVLEEGDINGDAVVSSFIQLANDIFSLISTTGTSIVDPQGTGFNQVVIHPFVQMRQLRRSRRKRANGAGIFQ